MIIMRIVAPLILLFIMQGICGIPFVYWLRYILARHEERRLIYGDLALIHTIAVTACWLTTLFLMLFIFARHWLVLLNPSK